MDPTTVVAFLQCEAGFYIEGLIAGVGEEINFGGVVWRWTMPSCGAEGDNFTSAENGRRERRPTLIILYEDAGRCVGEESLRNIGDGF